MLMGFGNLAAVKYEVEEIRNIAYRWHLYPAFRLTAQHIGT
jgi:hypothetical protein